jgi:hypothetical protein
MEAGRAVRRSLVNQLQHALVELSRESGQGNTSDGENRNQSAG